MAIFLTNRDGGKTDEYGHFKFNSAVWDGNVVGTGFTVTQNSPLGMSVIVGGGDAKIPYSNYAYTAWIPAASPETVTVTTADPSNPRIDRLVLYIDRVATPSSATPNNPTLAKLKLVAGTPGASPVRPSDATVNTAVSNNPYIDLADIRVNAAVTQITTANVTRTASQVTPLTSPKTWTPTITGFTLGNGTVNYSNYIKVGKMVICKYQVTLGSTSAVTGLITVTVPVDFAAS